MQKPTYQPSPRLSLWLLAALTLLAAGLRLPQLSTQSFWFDEAATWSQVNGSFLAMLSDTISDNYPPLYNTVTWFFVQVLGTAEWVLRLPAALFGIALVPMVYLLGQRVAGRTAGLLAALLITLSAFHLWYSLEARTYSLLALAACAFAWASLRDLELESRNSGRAIIAIGVALLLTHPYGAFDWMATAAAALLMSRQRRRLIRLHLITCAIYAPFALALLVHAYEITTGGFWIADPTPGFVLAQWLELTSWLLPALLAGTLLAFIPRRDDPVSPALPHLLALALVPAILGYAASLITQPIFLDRYLIGSLPALVVMATAGVTRWLTNRWLVAGTAVVIGVAGTVMLPWAGPPPRPDWRETAAAIAPRMTAEDCLVPHPAYDQVTWRYYAPGTCTSAFVSRARKQAGLRHLFYAVATRSVNHDVLDGLMSELRLVETTTIQRITVYEFEVEPRPE